MRASDELRERTVSRLGTGYAQGLMGFDTLCRRVDRAYGARTVEQLRALVRDLPDAGGLVERVRLWLRSRRADPPPGPALLTPPLAGRRGSFVLGRRPDCDLVVADGTVSRRHATLTCEDGRWTIRDLDSSNGTWVNGWRVWESGRVEPGDAVQLGESGWVFAPRA